MLNYLIGIGSIVGLMVLWVFVQSWWKRSFSEEALDEDALAGRSSCGNCGCSGTCSVTGKKKQHSLNTT